MPKPKNSSSFDDDEFNVTDLDKIEYVTVSPSGAEVKLLTQLEVDYYNDISQRYQKDNKFKNVSDLLELDRVLVHELMAYRWGLWLLNGGIDYYGNPVLNIEKNVTAYSKEIRELKAALGVDKKTREANKGANTADFIANLKIRAQEFGIHRNNQIIQIYNDFNELRGLITLYRNSNKSERNIFSCNEEDIISWCEEKFANYDKIDEAFKETQKIWIRDLND